MDRLIKFSYRFYLRQFLLVIQIKKEITSSVFDTMQPYNRNYKTFRKFFLVDLSILFSVKQVKLEREREKRILIIFLYILPHSLLEKKEKEGGVSSRVDTGNIRNEMEISSGGGDKGEWLAPGEEEGGIVIAYFLFLQEGEGEKKETFVLDRRRYPRWITRITYDFAEFNSNFPGDRRFDLNPRRNFSPLRACAVCICGSNM